MDVDEVINAKKELERKIANMIRSFESQTHTKVEYIEIVRRYDLEGTTGYLKVDMEVVI